MKMNGGVVLLLWFLCFLGVCWMASASVLLVGNNVTISFDAVQANFAPPVKGSGKCGVLYLANPLDACSELSNNVEKISNITSPFALVIRGGCGFDEKVRRVQKAGFKASIVYDNDDGFLVAMAGNAAGIKIHAVFVSKASGEMLKKYAGFTDIELWLSPTFDNSAWSIMAISFISLLAMSAVLATCFFVRRHHIRLERPRSSQVSEFHGMSKRLVKAMPSLVFTAVLDDNSTSRTCAVCLEDYTIGEKLRILPCCHKFHAFCIDSWLTTWRTFCPVCKHDARTTAGGLPASESTPLLSTTPSSVSSVLSSVRSLASSSSIQIAPESWTSPLASQTQSLASLPYIQQSFRSYHQSLSMSYSRSSVELRNTTSQRSHTSHLVSPASLNYPSVSPLNARYMSRYFPIPNNMSPSLVSSSGCQLNPLHYSGSAASFSPFASAHSLPEC
ncbi:Receptor-like proteiny region, transmembrane domain- and RING domain-containing protein 2 [Hibiscus syriacus]|uniref:Receptor-like proteiny region, transmembrane domain-and RING domain-containing protein 2 n=1 Tax=Hibiscus syriacus TaxID=106335 RepID=A0A6A2Y368_HIBSY|nr:receptor homology region, transmembrane domain- and RING domain-containing protein 2-like [Hibiscus syriacus]XP_039041836.1 receptor homology region, transmembrane domain- and RING domain-containing protein 2-like [Hibiscus syriacus]KAE8666519.1 Receptor-like proteiny region, transmembrane domain- and RING domain-containing protein 2 [Hibiscus syriacus]